MKMILFACVAKLMCLLHNNKTEKPVEASKVSVALGGRIKSVQPKGQRFSVESR